MNRLFNYFVLIIRNCLVNCYCQFRIKFRTHSIWKYENVMWIVGKRNNRMLGYIYTHNGVLNIRIICLLSEYLFVRIKSRISCVKFISLSTRSRNTLICRARFTIRPVSLDSSFRISLHTFRYKNQPSKVILLFRIFSWRLVFVNNG